MKLHASYSFHGGIEEWTSRDLYEWVTDIFEAPSVRVGPSSSEGIREHVQTQLSTAGWALNCVIEPEYSLTVTAKHRDLAFQIQTGNVSRAAYDLLKLQHLYLSRQIEAACLAMPSLAAAANMGSNLANSQRLSDEIRLFSRQITVPLLVISFE